MIYTITADGEPLYVPGDTTLTAITPKLTRELNKAGSLELTLLPTHPLYESILLKKTEIAVYRDGAEIWSGNASKSTRDFWNRKKLNCDGKLAMLNDSQRRPFEFTGTVSQYIQRQLDNHNAEMYTDTSKQIQLGTVTVTGTITRKSEVPASTWGLFSAHLLDALGGYLKMSKINGANYLDYVTIPGSQSEQIIQFGKNLLDLEDYIDLSEICTVLVPLGKKNEDGEYLDITSVNDGKNWVENGSATGLYGRIVKVEIWDDIEDPDELKAKGTARLAEILNVASTLTIKAIDLRNAGVNVDALELGDTIRIFSPPHGLDTYVLCSKIVERLDAPDQTEYTLGTTLKTLSGSSGRSSKNVIKIEAASEVKNKDINDALSVLDERVRILEERND